MSVSEFVACALNFEWKNKQHAPKLLGEVLAVHSQVVELDLRAGGCELLVKTTRYSLVPWCSPMYAS